MKYKDYEVFIETRKYANGRVAIQLVDNEDGMPVATSTVNLPDEDMSSEEVAIKNYSENEGILKFLIDNNIVDKPHRFIESGYVVIPICKILI